MMHEADRRPGDDTPAPVVLPPDGLVLRGAQVNGRVRCWPGEPHVAQLVMYQQNRPPTHDDLTRWCTDLARRGFTAVRTSALATAASARVESHGFTVIQQLVLLQHDEPSRVAAPVQRTARLLVDLDPSAAAVDRAAFGPHWSLDTAAVHDVRHATPRHRARAIITTSGTGGTGGTAQVIAYAITGRDSRMGFLQRLAVHPDHHRQGLGLALVHDSLRWLARWRVQRVLVNTPTNNEAALALYEGVGFHRLPDGLRVYERVLQ
jgi:ribosomal protein S18 acetylase RimI-like enzyme